MTKKENFIALLIILFARTAFMFGDAIFSAQKNENNTTNKALAQWQVEQRLHTSEHSSANDFVAQPLDIETQNETSQLEKTITDNIENGLQNTKLKIKDITNSVKDLEILEKIYQKDDSPDILKLLLQKLIEDYQFDKAKAYISDINIFEDKSVDAKTYIYTYINSLSITDNGSMTKFMSFIDQMRYKSMISSDDYIFYQWLAKLWAKDYQWANTLFAQIKSPIYSNFIAQVDDAIQKFDNQKWVPVYYKDSLIALVAMKNGYFSLADKLAIDSILQNADYVLPHQIVAYSNFLTNDREKAIENFYDLVELDDENQDKYNFYIGASHYRWWNNQESISVLSQLINSPVYKIDAYRYLLLNYQKLEDEQKMIQVRQKLLGQNNLVDSDFKNFYDVVFYQPFSTDSKYTTYSKHKQLSYDFVSVCYESLWQTNDTCLYGEVGLDVVNESRQDVQNGLLYLAENYPQAHIFQALWDYYKSQNLDDKAKTYYLKAVSLADNISQKSIIENKLISEIN